MNIPKYHHIISERKKVKAFLTLLSDTINAKFFDIEDNLIFIENEKNIPTMFDLGYDNTDVVDVLLQLNICNYSETLLDKVDQNPPWLYVFGIMIEGKEVYIKIKVRTEPECAVVCVSFHWSEYPMEYPYK